MCYFQEYYAKYLLLAISLVKGCAYIDAYNALGASTSPIQYVAKLLHWKTSIVCMHGYIVPRYLGTYQVHVPM